MSGNLGNLLPALRPTSEGEVIDSAIHWVTFHRASNDVQFSIRQLDMPAFCVMGMGSELLWEGK